MGHWNLESTRNHVKNVIKNILVVAERNFLQNQEYAFFIREIQSGPNWVTKPVVASCVATLEIVGIVSRLCIVKREGKTGGSEVKYQISPQELEKLKHILNAEGDESDS